MIDDEPCLQSNVIALVDSKNQQIQYQTSTETLTDIDENQPKECEASFTVYFNKMERKPGPGWRCSSLQTGEFAPIKQKTCDAAVHCNTLFLRHKQVS